MNFVVPGLVHTTPTAKVGEMVLLRISATTQRPLLVVSIDGTSVRGELFVDYERDWPAEWLTKNCFFPPDQEHRTVHVKSAKAGPGVGEWEPLR